MPRDLRWAGEDVVRTIILGIIGFVALAAGSASAADLPIGPVYKAVVQPTAFSWTGFYVGGNVGYGWGNSDPSTTTEFTSSNYWDIRSVPQVNTAGIGRVLPSGFVGGVQAGYNWQTGGLVLGAEVDFDSAELRASRTAGTAFACCVGNSFSMMQTTNTNWLFTARGRFGWAIEHWLIYGTGGVALTDLSHRSIYADTFGAGENVIDHGTKAGWVAGGGIQYAVTANWIIRGEYLHDSFDSISSVSILGPTLITGCSCTRMFHSVNFNNDIGRLGVDYKF